MQLFHSSGSPYARIARMAVLELGLEGRVSFSETTLRDPASYPDGVGFAGSTQQAPIG